MVAPRNQFFATFNGDNPLILAQRHDIPIVILKSVSYFTSETSISPIEHIQEISNVYNIHGITEDDVFARILASSSKGKDFQWYRGLPHKSIHSWDELRERLCKHFKYKSGYFSLLKLMTTIKRAPHECMIDFNYRFQKTWDIILVVVNPSLGNAFKNYLRDFNSDIVTKLQTIGRDTLPSAYDIAINAENCLMQGGMLAQKPLILIFPNIHTHQPIMAPIPIVSTSQSLIVVPPSSTYSNRKIEIMLETLM